MYYSDEEYNYVKDENDDYFSSDEEKYNNSHKKEELNLSEIIDLINEIIEEYAVEEPMLSSISFTDIFFSSNFSIRKNYVNSEKIQKLSEHLYCVVQDTLNDYEDTENVFLSMTQNKIYVNIVKSLNKYYILN